MQVRLSSLLVAALTIACTELEPTSEGADPCIGGRFCPGTLVCIDGLCVPGSGESSGGDGDTDTSNDGDGDGDGDGDTVGDGDGDTAGDGDGDTAGDGDSGGDMCGNGIVEGDEECDGPPTQTCVDIGLVSGELSCTPDCTLDSSACETCGNGQIEDGEICDGDNLNGWTCAATVYSRGIISCDGNCELDKSECCSYDGAFCWDSGDCCLGMGLVCDLFNNECQPE